MLKSGPLQFSTQKKNQHQDRVSVFFKRKSKNQKNKETRSHLKSFFFLFFSSLSCLKTHHCFLTFLKWFENGFCEDFCKKMVFTSESETLWKIDECKNKSKTLILLVSKIISPFFCHGSTQHSVPTTFK